MLAATQGKPPTYMRIQAMLDTLKLASGIVEGLRTHEEAAATDMELWYISRNVTLALQAIHASPEPMVAYHAFRHAMHRFLHDHEAAA
ncbi:MAG: hypothetical protein EXR67_03065 [Dehalococcoidia bacterium]|nr:hypothetical protein [Dehalococcoidia bacterium]